MSHTDFDITRPRMGPPVAAGEFFGHPKGLTVLFATEMWERFSYFGNAALVVLYMVKYLFEPGQVEAVIGYGTIKGALEFLFGPLERQPLASQLFGFYTGLAYFTPVIGGYLADRVLGQRRTVIIGALLMALGHFLMTFDSMFLFALAALILGVGAFKPNISTQVGALYPNGDSRRDRAYSIFYVGINIGAFLAPLVCGALQAWHGYHFGFAAAGIGMLISLAIYLHGMRLLPPDQHRHPAAMRDRKSPLTSEERRTVGALILICMFSGLFWATYDQQNNTLLLWIEDSTDRSIDLVFWQGEIPTPWFLSLNPLMIIAFTPVIVRLWAWQNRRGDARTTVNKMAFACLCVMLANLIMAVAAHTAGTGGKAGSLWLLAYFALVTLGELYLAPIGLALIATAAPPRMRSMMMGVWFATTFPADVLGGWLGGYWSSMTKVNFYLMIAAIAAAGGVTIWLSRPLIKTARSGG